MQTGEKLSIHKCSQGIKLSSGFHALNSSDNLQSLVLPFKVGHTGLLHDDVWAWLLQVEHNRNADLAFNEPHLTGRYQVSTNGIHNNLIVWSS